MAINNHYFDISNSDRICRICLLENINLSSIFDGEQDAENLTDVQKKIQICGDINIQQQDGLPGLICSLCSYKASVAFEFRQLCQNSDTRLRLYYNKPARFSAMDSGTQTELEAQNFITKSITLTNDYFVKDESINNTQFQNTLVNSQFVQENINNRVIHTIHNPITMEEAKLYQCQINFEQPMMEKVMDCTNHAVDCLQEQISVLSENSEALIEQVCASNTNEHSEIKFKNQESYFNSMKEEQIVQEIINEKKDNETVNVQSQMGIDESNEIDFEKVTEENEIIQEKNSIIEDMEINFDEIKKEFKCENCPKIYSSEKGFKKHLSTHEKKNKCEICHKTFFKIENLKKHQVLHETKPHACQLCHVYFSKYSTLLRHLKTHTEKELNDQINEEVETLNKNLNNENDSGNEIDPFDNAPKLYKCKMCNQYCSSLKNLKRHALLHGEKKYFCTVCDKSFYRADTLKKHAEKHGHGLLDNLNDDNNLFDSEDEPLSNESDQVVRENSDDDVNGEFKCQYCDKVMATKKGLGRHLAAHKPKPESATCDICNKVFASGARLSMHKKVHDKPKEKVPREYLCHICSKVYPSNSSLTYHMRTHTGIKPHVCNICNNGFTTTTSLTNHLRIHSGDKPFVCHVCSAAFAVSSAFRRHLTRHTGEANYPCKTCGKAFKRLSTLKEHTYTHSGEKPYVCKNCGAAYSHSGSLFAHQKRCRAQYTGATTVEQQNLSSNIALNDVQSDVRSMAVIGQIF